MFTGQLVHHQGSLARAALPYVVQLRWGWHRVERALERGQFSLDALFERALSWCVACLPVEPVRLGSEQRTVHAIDSSTIARWRSRKNVALRRAPAPRRRGQRGRSPVHGAVVHPGAKRPEGRPDEDRLIVVEKRTVRVRRWNTLHFPRTPQTVLDVVRVDDPAYKRPLLIGTTARELTTEEIRQAYGHRWPIETNFFVAQDTCAMEQPRAWTETALSRRIGLALLCGSLLKAIAAACTALPIGPWDRKAVSTAGRLAHYLDLHSPHFAALALSGLTPRKYTKKSGTKQINDLQFPEAA